MVVGVDEKSTAVRPAGMVKVVMTTRAVKEKAMETRA